MTHILLRAILSALALLLVAALGIGVRVDGFFAALIGAVILALVNAFLRPLLLLLTLPVNIMTLGLFTLVVNGLLFWLVMWWVPGLGVKGFFPALVGSLLYGVITWGLTALFRV